ncbi:MAG: hypothetical protein P4L90_13500 [Rhodopila sp.]|nr:hypothetical protein [Rhodopila sp.]
MYLRTPYRCTGRIEALWDDLGLLLEINCGGKLPRPKKKEALRLLCQQMMPRFR